jgi:hypothetical protein
VVQLHVFLLQFDDFLLEVDKHGTIILILTFPFVDFEFEGVDFREEIADADLMGRSFAFVRVTYLLYLIHKLSNIFILSEEFFLQMRDFLLMLFSLN